MIDARQTPGHGFCWGNGMAARYLEAMQCLNLIAPERLAEALRIADARVGLQSFQEGCDSRLKEVVFSVPDDQFRWFRLVLRKMAEKYERHKNGAAVLPQLEFAASRDTLNR
ncbi:MAG TPA: hypothetical protein VEL09_15190 [Burkholderiales bacterium]|nr:hypothetical protein [Burkholderiales bacterium]